MRLDCSGMEFEKLADLLEQGQFELLNLPVGDEKLPAFVPPKEPKGVLPH